ncbi:MAG: response regulator transcription factor [Chloroflexi bacterium]|nr:response regulator transcription factor [Chloroflexota bacterium]
MKQPRIAALIVVRSHPLRDGLQALMVGWPEIDAVTGTNNIMLVLDDAYDRHPALVLVDGDAIGTPLQAALQRIKSKWPHSRCVFISKDVSEQQEAKSAGADVALLTGFPAADLRRTVMRLLSPEQAVHREGTLTCGSHVQSNIGC